MIRQVVVKSLAATIGRQRSANHDSPLLAAPLERAAFIRSIPTDEEVLEIGPFDRPCLSGPAIRYFDVLSQEQLKQRARIEPRHDPDRCPFIHYVSPKGDLSVVDTEFSAVFSSHCIEHQPDLIAHLRGIGRLLRPGGRYYLIVPDKRFCFDHFQAETTIDDVRSAKGRTLHTEKAVSEEVLGRTHNRDVLHWLGIHGTPRRDRDAQARSEELLSRARAGEYVDVHAWRFTPASFHAIVRQLFDENSIDLEPTEVHNTGFGTLEFMAVLTRSR